MCFIARFSKDSYCAVPVCSSRGAGGGALSVVGDPYDDVSIIFPAVFQMFLLSQPPAQNRIEHPYRYGFVGAPFMVPTAKSGLKKFCLKKFDDLFKKRWYRKSSIQESKQLASLEEKRYGENKGH